MPVAISDLNDLYTAIQSLRYATEVIDGRLVQGTNSELYDWVKNVKHVIKRAEESYSRLRT